jgi:hypothetical protein
MEKQNLPEGVLSRTYTQNGVTFLLTYNEQRGYYVGSRFEILSAHLSLELAQAITAAAGMVNYEEVPALIRHARAEFKRLERKRFSSAGAKQWAIINGALNRLEGKKLRVGGRHKEIERWEASQ